MTTAISEDLRARRQHGGLGAPGRDWAMPGRTTITRCSRPLTSTAKEAAVANHGSSGRLNQAYPAVGDADTGSEALRGRLGKQPD